jgi:acyl-CoA synthetase (AMP-forming)/AMP-acid ligase II
VIILRGRNLHAHDVEAMVSLLPEVRTGNVVAFGAPADPSDSDAQERLVVVAESREPDNANVIARSIRTQVGDGLGIVPDEVVIVPPGTLPKTSSGKLQRSETRNRWLAGSLAPPRSRPLETVGIVVKSGLSFMMNRVRAN